MADWNPEANALFLEALDLHLAERRRAYLDQACGDNTALHAQVGSLRKGGRESRRPRQQRKWKFADQARTNNPFVVPVDAIG